jgi:hypothetical protein
MTRVVPITMLAGVAVLSPTLAGHADPVMMRLKLGLWEMTATPHMTGQVPIPDDKLAALPPEQRARLENAIRQSTSRPHVARTCITAEKLQKGFDVDRHDGSCKRKVLSNSASAMAVHEECSSEEGTRVADFQFQAKSPEAVTGTVHMHMARGGKAMDLQEAIVGHWVASDCGAIK